jgi:microcystin-dependent protein
MPYVGEIRLFAYDRIPSGWLVCDGSSQYVATNQALFHLIGNTYGGDGVSTFCLPNMAGCTVYGYNYSGATHPVGSMVGSETTTMTLASLPAHSHSVVVPANEAPKASDLNGMHSTPAASHNVLATTNDPTSAVNIVAFYNNLQPDTVLNVGLPAPSLGNTGNANPEPINLMQPYLVLNYCICAYGGYWPQPGDGLQQP